MSLDLTRLTAGQIAVLGGGFTLLAAVTAALAAVLVAKINANAARSLDVAKSRRAYYQRVFEPYFVQLDADIVSCSEVVSFIERSNWVDQTSIDKERFEEVFGPLRERHFMEPAPTAISAVAQRDSSVRRVSMLLTDAREAVTASAHAVVYLVSTGDQLPWQTRKVEHLRGTAKSFVDVAVHFREHLEQVMFKGR